MQCPHCTKGTQVLDSRPDGKSVKRRRKCKSCGTKFNTVEHLDGYALPAKPRKPAKPKPPKPAAAPAPKQEYKPKNRGRDLDDIWDDLSDGGEGLSLRDLGLD
jgi:hypothetical protein